MVKNSEKPGTNRLSHGTAKITTYLLLKQVVDIATIHFRRVIDMFRQMGLV
jgi:hypothetical protein